MLYYSEYNIYEHQYQKLRSLKVTMQKEIAEQVKSRIDRSLKVLSQGKHHFAWATHQLKYCYSFLSRYDQRQLDWQHITREDYHLSSHYTEYLQVLTYVQELKLKISHIDRYLAYFGDAVQVLSTSVCSVSTYLRLDTRIFSGMSLTDFQDSLFGQDRLEKKLPSWKLLKMDNIKVRISDHLPSDYSARYNDIGDLDIIISDSH